MRQFAKWAVVSALLFAASGATGHAADAAKKFAIHGAGAETCRETVAAIQRDKTVVPLIASWVFGYLTALNGLTRDTFDISPITDARSLMEIVYNECAQHPDLTAQAAIASVFGALSRASVHKASPLVEAQAAGKTVAVRAETLATMQAALAAQGLYDGKPDGVFGPKVEAALRSYQHAAKLPETGLPDTPTILRLLIEPKSAISPRK